MDHLLDEEQILTTLEAALDNAAADAPITVSYKFGDVIAARQRDGMIDITAEVLIEDDPVLITESPLTASEHLININIVASERATETLNSAMQPSVIAAIAPEHQFLRRQVGLKHPTPLERVQKGVEEDRYVELYSLYELTTVPLEDVDTLFTERQ